MMVGLFLAHHCRSQNLEWVWVQGDSASIRDAVYGTKGVPDANNTPGSRNSSVSWTDENGDLWLYGGFHSGAAGGRDMNDVWRWKDGSWTWMSGSKIGEDPKGVYGTKGIPHADNYPGRRVTAITAQRNGVLYLYGGFGVDGSGNTGYLSDLWKWEKGLWTWVAGSNGIDEAPKFGIKGVPASDNTPGHRAKGVAWIDEGGVFWLFGGNALNNGNLERRNDLWKWFGNNWTWVNGAKGFNAGTVYGRKGVPAANNVPGARYDGMTWVTKTGDLMLLGGYVFNASGSGPTNELWRWNGSQWAWMSGEKATETTKAFGKYITPGGFEKGHIPGARALSGFATSSDGTAYIFGGLGNGATLYGGLLDVWKWEDGLWGWLKGDSEPYDIGFYGEKGVPAPQNRPGSRVFSTMWVDNEGDVWVYGGNNYGRGIMSDLWRLEREKVRKLFIYGNELLIENNDLTPNKNDGTDFGLVKVGAPSVRRQFVIENGTNQVVDITAPIGFTTLNAFKVVRQPGRMSLSPADTVHFSIEFSPTEKGVFESRVAVESTDPTGASYQFLISGVGLESDLKLLDTVFCSRASFSINSKSYNVYSLLISDSGKMERPVSGINYQPSRHYQKASLIDEHARLSYQGDPGLVYVEGLIAGRSYQASLVPGNWDQGNIIYDFDSISTEYFSTPVAGWASQVALSPSSDSTYCIEDTLFSTAKSPFDVVWMDGLIQKKRSVATGQHYFLSQGDDHCWVSSDTVNVVVNWLPRIDSIVVLEDKPPYCPGNSISLIAYTTGDEIWADGSKGAEYIISRTGTYTVTSTTGDGCDVKDSLFVKFEELPYVAFAQDEFLYGDRWEIEYTTDVFELQWYFGEKRYPKLDSILPLNDGSLIIEAISNLGCKTTDTLWVVVPEIMTAIPNAFSPDGNSINDVWFVNHQDPNGVLTVFNRWGGIVHKGTNAWSGRVFGVPVPSGTYFFTYKLSDNEEILSGVIHVVR